MSSRRKFVKFVPGQDNLTLESRIALTGDMVDAVGVTTEEVNVETASTATTSAPTDPATLLSLEQDALDLKNATDQFNQIVKEQQDLLNRSGHDNDPISQAGYKAALVGSSVTGYWDDGITDPDPMQPALSPH